MLIKDAWKIAKKDLYSEWKTKAIKVKKKITLFV